MAIEVKDARSLVEQAAATGVEAALSKSGQAKSKFALAKVDGVQVNTQCALDRALNVVKKGREEREGLHWQLKEATEGRHKAKDDAARLRVVVEALRGERDDMQQVLGVAEAQVCSLTSRLSATFRAQWGV